MIKTNQYLAEADNSRVLVALDLKAAFQNVSRRAMLYSIAQTDADLAAVFSKWYTGTTEHRMHHDSANTKISANSGWIRVVLCQRVDSQLSLTLYFDQSWRHKYGKVLARTPFHLNSKTKSHSPSVAWGDIYKSMVTLCPALLFWVSRPPWRQQHNAFRRLPPHKQTLTLRDSMCRQ